LVYELLKQVKLKPRKTHTYCHSIGCTLTFILLMWTFGRAPNNASKWEIGFNSVA